MLQYAHTSSFSWCRGTLCSLEGFWKMCATGRASRRPWFVRSCPSTRHLVSTGTDKKGIPHEAVHGQGTSEPELWLRCQCCTGYAHSAATSIKFINPGTSLIKPAYQGITSRAARLRCNYTQLYILRERQHTEHADSISAGAIGWHKPLH